MHDNFENLTPEALVGSYSVYVTQEILFPENKMYTERRIKCEKEILRRLGGSWERFCWENGMEETHG